MAQVEGQGEREAALVGDCLLQELERGLEQVWRERGRKRQPDPGLALRGLPVTADFAHTSAGVLAGSDLRHELWSGQGGGEAASVAGRRTLRRVQTLLITGNKPVALG